MARDNRGGTGGGRTGRGKPPSGKTTSGKPASGKASSTRAFSAKPSSARHSSARPTSAKATSAKPASGKSASGRLVSGKPATDRPASPKPGSRPYKPHAPQRAHGAGRPQARRGDRFDDEDGELWLFGIHAVRDALENPRRKKLRLLVTPNALERLGDSVARARIEPEMQDSKRFAAPLDPASVHQGAALLTEPLEHPLLKELAEPTDSNDAPRILLLDRVTDPHNVGAILRSAEAFGARVVVAPIRHSAPESGALAKAASGALERQPYVRITNLSRAMTSLKDLGYVVIGLAGEAEIDLDEAIAAAEDAPLALVLGAEGPGMRQLTRDSCDALARIPAAGEFASLNVSNAAAVALYAARPKTRR